MSWCSLYNNTFFLAMVTLTGKFEAHLVPEDDGPFGGAGLSSHGGLSGAGTGSVSSSSQTNGLKRVIRGRFDVSVDVSLSMTTSTFLK